MDCKQLFIAYPNMGGAGKFNVLQVLLRMMKEISSEPKKLIQKLKFLKKLGKSANGKDRSLNFYVLHLFDLECLTPPPMMLGYC